MPGLVDASWGVVRGAGPWGRCLMMDRHSPVSESVQAWLLRKIQSGKLLRLPTYYPQVGDAGHRPDKYARKLLIDLENPQDCAHPHAWRVLEADLFRRWVESGPSPRPIHPASGSVAARQVVAPEGVTWSPPGPTSERWRQVRPVPRGWRVADYAFRPGPRLREPQWFIGWVYYLLRAAFARSLLGRQAFIPRPPGSCRQSAPRCWRCLCYGC